MGSDSRKNETDERYWTDYDGLQAVKHRILAKYLDGWFPILSSFRGLLLYLDCHAGRGRHRTGDPGSPIVVLERLLRHQLRKQILERVQVGCHFFELDEANAARLNDEIASLGFLPARIGVQVHVTDYEAAVSATLEELEKTGSELPPSFAFIDPYGFKLSMRFLNRVLRAGRTEVLINFMYRYVIMAVFRPDKEPILDELFGTRAWRQLRSIDDKEERFGATMKLFSAQLAADHVLWIVMRGESGEIKYVLFYGTNNLMGRRVMKRAIWKALPDGSFTAYERDRPEQGVLISAKHIPFRELIQILSRGFGGRTIRLEEVYAEVDRSPYRRVHLHELLRRAIKRGVVRNLDEPGHFVISRNPRLEIPEALPASLAIRGGDTQPDLFGGSPHVNRTAGPQAP